MAIDRSPLKEVGEQSITARLAAAGSRRSEMETVLSFIDPLTEIDKLRSLVLDENVSGKRSASAREKTWRQLRERYVLDAAAPEYRAFIQSWQRAGNRQDQGLICFLMMARADRTFRELTLATVSALLSAPSTQIDAEDVHEHLLAYLADHELEWTDKTAIRVRQHTLSSLKDFGLLHGSQRKETARVYPGSQVAVFAAQLGKLEGLTDLQVLDSLWFRLLGCDRRDAINLLYLANREGALEFRMQAEVVELELPEVA